MAEKSLGLERRLLGNGRRSGGRKRGVVVKTGVAEKTGTTEKSPAVPGSGFSDSLVLRHQ